MPVLVLGSLQSQDVLEYFTAHGHSAQKKLFYLVRPKREWSCLVLLDVCGPRVGG